MRNSYGSLQAIPGLSGVSNFEQLKSLQKPVTLYRWVSIFCCLVVFFYAVITLSFGILAMRCANPPYEDIAIKTSNITGRVNTAAMTVITQRGDIYLHSTTTPIFSVKRTSRSANEGGLDDIEYIESIKTESKSLLVDYSILHGEWEVTSCTQTDLDVTYPSNFVDLDSDINLETEQGDIDIYAVSNLNTVNVLVSEEGDVNIESLKGAALTVNLNNGDLVINESSLKSSNILVEKGSATISNIVFSAAATIRIDEGMLFASSIDMGGQTLSVSSYSDDISIVGFKNGVLNIPIARDHVSVTVTDDLVGTFSIRGSKVRVSGDGAYEITSSIGNQSIEGKIQGGTNAVITIDSSEDVYLIINKSSS